MYKAVVMGSIIGSAYIFCLTINLFDAALMFLFFGITPDRATQLPATLMLQAYAIASVVFVVTMFRHQLGRAVAMLPISVSRSAVAKKPTSKNRRSSAKPTRPKAATPLARTVLHPLLWRLGASKH